MNTHSVDCSGVEQRHSRCYHSVSPRPLGCHGHTRTSGWLPWLRRTGDGRRQRRDCAPSLPSITKSICSRHLLLCQSSATHNGNQIWNDCSIDVCVNIAAQCAIAMVAWCLLEEASQDQAGGVITLYRHKPAIIGHKITHKMAGLNGSLSNVLVSKIGRTIWREILKNWTMTTTDRCWSTHIYVLFSQAPSHQL